ncbi:hypothetical protein RI054_06g33240 [Pseudoscourfieldia marina]
MEEREARLERTRLKFHESIHSQLYSDEDGFNFFNRIKEQIKEINNKIEVAQAAFTHQELLLTNILCVDPGAEVSQHLILPYLHGTPRHCQRRGVGDRASQLCRADSQLCRAASQLCRAASQLCRADSQPCRADSQLCRAASQLCRAASQLCRADSQLCRAASQLCRAASHCRADSWPVPVSIWFSQVMETHV